MSIYSHQAMTNRHDSGFLSEIRGTLHVWRERGRQRRELAQWTEQDLHDIGLSRGEVLRETEKPFWRA